MVLAWSGCPAHLLPQWLAGLRPLEPGWRRFSVELPQEPLSFSTRVPLDPGDVEVRCSREGWQTMLWLSVPPGTECTFTPPMQLVKERLKINGWLVVDHGEQRALPPGCREEKQGSRATLALAPGHYTVEAF